MQAKIASPDASRTRLPCNGVTDAPPFGPTAAALDLQHTLLLRLLVFALISALILLAVHAWQVRRDALADVSPTTAIVQQLLNQDQPRQADAFNRESIRVDLAILEPLARRLAFCVEVEDLWVRIIAAACMRPSPPRPGAETLARWLEAAHAATDAAQRPLLRAPGVTVGEIRVRPDWQAEASRWLFAVYVVVASWVALGILAAIIALPVRRALRPADHILAAIGRLEAGDTHVRLPPFELREFRKIANEFNSLAAQLAETRATERRLATRLLDVRERERHYLARELHDDMGQHLTSLRADTAYLRQSLAAPTSPLGAVLDSLSDTLARMHESIQNIVHRLRPARLEAFGLIASLEHLVSECARPPVTGTCIEFRHHGPLDTLPPALATHLYRIVQEGLTNALRHAAASLIEIDLGLDGDRLTLSIRDDGKGDYATCPATDGHGRVGIRERVSALGGRVAWQTAAGMGTHLVVELPSPSLGTEAP